MLTTWVVIYTLNTGRVYGWFTRTLSACEAEKEFYNSMLMADGRIIKCICELESNIMDAFLAMYEDR